MIQVILSLIGVILAGAMVVKIQADGGPGVDRDRVEQIKNGGKPFAERTAQLQLWIVLLIFSAVALMLSVFRYFASNL